MQRKRSDLKMELLSTKKKKKREPALKVLENSQPIYVIKHKKACSEENTKSVVK